MPSAFTIVEAATRVANQWQALAIVWHVLLAGVAAALFAGWRPDRRRFGYLLIAPLISVAVVSWSSGNPFNGFVFVVLSVVLANQARTVSSRPVRVDRATFVTGGVLLVAFGWAYPHFLSTDRWTPYLYAAPFGLLPCPTLSVVIGLTLAGLRHSPGWSRTLAVAGLVYGLVGVLALHVHLDYALIVGAAVLALTTVDLRIVHEDRWHIQPAKR
jgi:hypothetical protein